MAVQHYQGRTFGRQRREDVRDHDFHMLAVLPKASKRTTRNWNDTYWVGDQGDQPACVGFSWCGWLEADPITHGGIHPCVDPFWIYHEAQKVDSTPGEDYDGSTVRAGAKVLQAAGFITSYHWAWDVETIIRALLDVGPVTVGTIWTSGMMTPTKQGLIRPTGQIVGGHAYLLTGADRNTGRIRIRNSWGIRWGMTGHAYITFTDFAKLLRQQGEACLAVESTKIVQ